jgi:hypothetical protein
LMISLVKLKKKILYISYNPYMFNLIKQQQQQQQS